jgi:hypothetical protein
VPRAFLYPRWLAWTAAVVAVIAVAGGFLIDPKGFAGNALAELAGMIASILVAVLVVERLVAADRNRRWSEVADSTLRTLNNAVVQTSLEIYLLLPAPRPPDADPFSMGIADELPSALATLAAAFHKPSNAAALPDDPREIYELVRESSALIRETIVPRLLLIGGAPALVSPLVALERSIEALEYDAWLYSRFGLPPGVVADDLASVIDAFARVAEAEQQARARFPEKIPKT